MILVDTSVLIDFFKGIKNNASENFKKILINKIPFGITSFIFQEVLQGAKTESEFIKLKGYLESQTFYHPKDLIKSYEESAKIYFDLRKNGFTIRSTIDCLIAQIVKEHDLYLLHHDSDFDKIAKVIDIKIY